MLFDTTSRTLTLSAETTEKKFNNPKFSEPFANEYYGAISERLSAWIPVGSGLKAVINIYIYSDGKFDYEILKESTSKEFNDSLKAFLEKQKDISVLQSLGAGKKLIQKIFKETEYI